MRILQLLRSILARTRPNKMIKRGRMRNPRRQILKPPQIPESLQHRRRAIRRRLPGRRIRAPILNIAAGRVRRDQPRRHPAAQPVVRERVLLPVRRLFGVRRVVRPDGARRRDVVEEAARFVIGDEQQRRVPLRACAEGVVDFLDEHLSGRDVAGGVHGVGGDVAAGRVDVGELGEGALFGVLDEFLDRDDVLLGVLGGPFEEEGVWEEFAACAVVVAPGYALFAGELEDVAGFDARVVEVFVVGAVSVARAGDGDETVGVRGLK